MQWYCQLGKYEEAVKVAIAVKDKRLVEEVQRKVPQQLLATKLMQGIFAEANRELA